MKKQALGPNDWPLIKNYLMGGAAIGGSAALITSLLNHLNEIKSENENPLDKDTFKLIVKSPKKEEKENKISVLVKSGYSLKTIRVELAKTDLVCRNCHGKLHDCEKRKIPFCPKNSKDQDFNIS